MLTLVWGWGCETGICAGSLAVCHQWIGIVLQMFWLWRWMRMMKMVKDNFERNPPENLNSASQDNLVVCSDCRAYGHCHLLPSAIGTFCHRAHYELIWLCNAADCRTPLTWKNMWVSQALPCATKWRLSNKIEKIVPQLSHVCATNWWLSNKIDNLGTSLETHDKCLIIVQSYCQHNLVLKIDICWNGSSLEVRRRGRSPDGRRGEAQTGTFSAQTIFSLPWTPSTLQKDCL